MTLGGDDFSESLGWVESMSVEVDLPSEPIKVGEFTCNSTGTTIDIDGSSAQLFRDEFDQVLRNWTIHNQEIWATTSWEKQFSQGVFNYGIHGSATLRHTPGE
jgi:hypothetical protein